MSERTGEAVGLLEQQRSHIETKALLHGFMQLRLTLAAVLFISLACSAQNSPPTYSGAIRNTNKIPVPSALPNWGAGAGTIFTDPLFNPKYPPQYVRVTDSNTYNDSCAHGLTPAYSGYAVGSGGGDDIHFNSNDTLFWISDAGNSTYFFGLNPTTLQVGCLYVGPGGGWPGQFSQVNSNYFFQMGGDGTVTLLNFSGCSLGGGSCSPTSSPIFSFINNCQANPHIVAYDPGVVGGQDNVFGNTYSSNAAGQDTGNEVYAYVVSSGTCYYYNTQYRTIHSYTTPLAATTGTISCNGTTTITWTGGSVFTTGPSWVGLNFGINNGGTYYYYQVASVASSTLLTVSRVAGTADCPAGSYPYRVYPGTYMGTAGPTTDSYHVHDIRLDPTGAWLLVEDGGCIGANTCQAIHAWQLGTTTVNDAYYNPATDDDSGAACCHYTENAYGWINTDSWYDAIGVGSPISPSLLFRTWQNFSSIDDPSKTTEETTVNVALDPNFDNHPTNKNDPTGTNSFPVFTSTIAPSDSYETNFAYSNEIIAWPLSSPGNPFRFGHDWNSSQSPSFTAEEATGAVSQTGRFYLYTTDGLGTLGSTSGGSTCILTSNCRSDVFILNLASPAAN